MQWRWIRDTTDDVPPALTGVRNMAVDAALLESVAGGAPPALRLYRWSPACLSLGRNQAARDVYDPAKLASLGFDLVRRPTGGLAVLHDEELTYAVAIPADRLGGPRRTYHALHGAIARALTALGADTRLAGPARGAAGPGGEAPPCFADPVGGEVVSRGRKLVGSAQRTERRTVLQHGSILVAGRQDRVDALRVSGTRVADGSIALSDLLGTAPAWPVLARALREGFTATLGVEFVDDPLSPAELDLARRLEATYRDDAWTWRR